jgi:hypothetical protein
LNESLILLNGRAILLNESSILMNGSSIRKPRGEIGFVTGRSQKFRFIIARSHPSFAGGKREKDEKKWSVNMRNQLFCFPSLRDPNPSLRGTKQSPIHAGIASFLAMTTEFGF